MNYAEIIKLLDAGYTREEILNMQQDQQDQQNQQNQQDQQDQQNQQNQQNQQDQQDQQNQQNQQNQQDPAQASVDKLTTLLTTIDGRIKDLQAANILQAQQPGGSDNHVKTAEEALTELIRPQLKGGN